jgi:hypothetical protein
VALLLDVELFLTDQRTTIVAVAARHKQPAVYGLRELVDGAS